MGREEEAYEALKLECLIPNNNSPNNPRPNRKREKEERRKEIIISGLEREKENPKFYYPIKNFCLAFIKTNLLKMNI